QLGPLTCTGKRTVITFYSLDFPPSKFIIVLRDTNHCKWYFGQPSAEDTAAATATAHVLIQVRQGTADIILLAKALLMHIRRSQFLVLAPSWLAGKKCGFSYADPHRFQYD